MCATWYAFCVDEQSPTEKKKPVRRQKFGRPRRQVPSPPVDKVPIGEIPPALLTPDPPVESLVKVGEVCGQHIYARKEVIDRAAQIRAAHPERENWPSDALRATILALRIGITPRPTFREIAVMLNMSERHVLRIIKQGKKDAGVEGAISKIDREGLPMAVENLLEGLEARDKDYTLEVLKGRNVLNPKGVPQGDSGPAATFSGLVVQFVHDGSSGPVRPGAITANPNLALAPPKVIDATTVPVVRE